MAHYYDKTFKKRNTGKWWYTREMRIAERQAVRRQEGEWWRKAHNPRAFARTVEDVLVTPDPPPLRDVSKKIRRHRQTWRTNIPRSHRRRIQHLKPSTT